MGGTTAPPDAKRVFLSYGRADASALAERLHRDLSNRGFVPWQDTRELIGGPAWADQIVQGLQSTGVFLALLSPHSVRTRAAGADIDSVCLQEIAYACYQTRTPIVPVMTVAPPCEAPLDIYRLQFIDFSRWEQSPSEYDQAFQRLQDAVEAALRGETRYRSWVDMLQPHDFGEYLHLKRRRFSGREWLFDEIRTWIQAGSETSLLVTGDPGIGKSAFVAELVHRNPDGAVLAYHCCQARQPETLAPGPFVRSLAAMVAGRVPEYAAMLDRPDLRRLLGETACDKDPESALDRGVLTQLALLPPPSEGRRLLVIDALDESVLPDPADGRPRPVSIVRLLRAAVDRLPPWLRILATTRPELPVLEALAGLKSRRIDAQDSRNLDDIKEYTIHRLGEDPLAGKLRESGRPAQSTVTGLAERSMGSFLYVEKALEAVANGQATFADLDDLPPGLEAQFRWFFERQFPLEAQWKPLRHMFEVLVAAQDLMTAEDMASAMGVNVHTELPALLAAAASFLRKTLETPQRFTVYHKSLTDWLTDAGRSGDMYAASPAAGHQYLAEGLYARYEFDPGALSRYALSHLATHLAWCARNLDPLDRRVPAARLVRFVLDPAVQFRRSDLLGMHANLVTALEIAVQGPPLAAVPQALKTALGLMAFRRERLNAEKLFTLASTGDLEAFEKEIDLFAADRWRDAGLLVGAWLARSNNGAAADALRRRVRSDSLLDERVDAVFDGRPPVLPPLPSAISSQDVSDVFAEVGALDNEGGALASTAYPSFDPLTMRPSGDEGTPYLADIHAPKLVAFAQVTGEAGARRLRDYISLHAANAYRVYRDESLWRIASAALRHPDDGWALDMMRVLCQAALSESGREFTQSAPVALLFLRAAQRPADRPPVDAAIAEALAAAESLTRDRSDAWGDHRRRFCALAESIALVDGDRARAVALLDRALELPYGFAGFQAPASLGLAESYWICGAPPERTTSARQSALAAADRIQDPVFCVRTLSRCVAITKKWWGHVPGFSDPVSFVDLVGRFIEAPQSAEFAAVHIVGWDYPGRRTSRSIPLPASLRAARCLRQLAQEFDWPVEDFLRVNPGIQDAATDLPDGSEVLVPDPRLRTWLAARFSAEALMVHALPREDRIRQLLRLLPAACASPTAADKVLARLLLALRQAAHATIDDIAQSMDDYLPRKEAADSLATTRLGPA